MVRRGTPPRPVGRRHPATILVGGLIALAGAVPGRSGSVEGQTVARLTLQQYTLPNGLQVILHEDHTIPVVAVNTYYHVGSGDERPGRTGLAYLLQHIMLMGSQHVPAGKFDQWLEAAGGSNNSSTSEDRTAYFEWMPSSALRLALWLDADRMGWVFPSMDLSKVDLQRKVVNTERRESVDNQPYGRAEEVLLAALFPRGHPYSWPVIGSMVDVSAASLADVRTFCQTYYAPNNATIVVAGDFRPDSAKRWIARYFATIPQGAVLPPRPRVHGFALRRDTSLVLEDHVRTPRLFYAWHTVKAFHPDDAALTTLAYILAGDTASRLYRTLARERQAADNVNAAQEGRRLDGFFELDVTPRPDASPGVIDQLVAAEIGRIIDEGVTERELQRAKTFRQARVLDEVASLNRLADLLNYYNWFVGTPDYVEQDAARYEQLTAADVQRAAADYLAASRVVLTVVPPGKQELQVEAITR